MHQNVEVIAGLNYRFRGNLHTSFVDRFASCENIVPRIQTRSCQVSFPLKETLLQPVLKSFITVFIQYNEGLENKLTRASLLGLAKSLY